MTIRTMAVTAAIAGLVALGGSLSACGSQPASPGGPATSAQLTPGSSTPSSPDSPSAPAAEAPVAVQLATAFSPRTLHLKVGGQFRLTVSDSVKASGLSCVSGGQNSMLSVRCEPGGSYLFTATRAGSTAVSATVRPNCPATGICPQWIALARLTISIA
jgi:hypothetical protein